MPSSHFLTKRRSGSRNRKLSVGNPCCIATTGLLSLLCLTGGATQISVHYLTKAFLASLLVSTSSNSLSNSESISSSNHSFFSAQSPDIPKYFQFSSRNSGLFVGAGAVGIGLTMMMLFLLSVHLYICKRSSEKNYRKLEEGIDFRKLKSKL